MKINYTMHGLGLSGGTRTVLELANRLVDRGHKVSVTTINYRGDMDWFRKANFHPKFKIIFAPFVGSFSYRVVKRLFRGSIVPFYPYVENKALIKVMPECDVNVGTVSYSAFAVYESGKGKPFHHYMHYEPILFSDIQKKRLIEETYYLPTVKIINSTWLQKMMKENLGIIVDSKNIVQHGFNNEYFHPRLEIKKDPSKKRIISLGKSVDFKGLADLLSAFRIVHQKNRAVELILFTSEKLKLPSDLPIKVFNSPVNDELGKLYNSADVMVNASWFESFPWPPVEAMASGVPVVTTPYGTEDFAFDGENALVVPPKNPQRMADAIIRLLDDSALRDKLAQNGFRTAKKFTWENLTDQVEKIFKDNL